MEIAQIKQKLTQLDHVISLAAQAVQSDRAAPQELKDCVRELDAQSKEAQLELSNGEEDETLIQCVDDMEETSDRAKRACESAKELGAQLRTAVNEAHQQLSELKHQLH